MKILFLHGWHSVPGGVKPTYLKCHGHDVINPVLDDDNFDTAVAAAQAEFNKHQPQVVVGSSRGGAVAMNIDSGDAKLVLLCPAWKKYGTTTTVKLGTVILHSRADDVVPLADSEQLAKSSGASLIEVGSDHRLADPEPLAAMLTACEHVAFERKSEVGRVVEKEEITVLIGQFRHTSVDGGETWIRSLREIPAENMPVIHGKFDSSRLPPLKGRGAWDFATILDSGTGAVAAHELDERASSNSGSQLCVFLTNNAGVSWRRFETAELLGANREKAKAWGVEKADALVMPNERNIVVAWQEPWLYDQPRSHVISSLDGGHTWRHADLAENNPYLGQAPEGRLLSLNDGYFLVSRDGGQNWMREAFRVEWPLSYQGKKIGLLRHVEHVERNRAYALIVHWTSAMEVAGIGLVLATDQGKTWRHLCTLPSPNYGDVNARHALSLRIGKTGCE